jgi:hypothetical protein
MLWFWDGRSLLCFLPIRHEFRQNLRLDGGARLVVDIEGGQFNAPLCNSSCCVAVVDDVLQWSFARPFFSSMTFSTKIPPIPLELLVDIDVVGASPACEYVIILQ